MPRLRLLLSAVSVVAVTLATTGHDARAQLLPPLFPTTTTTTSPPPTTAPATTSTTKPASPAPGPTTSQPGAPPAGPAGTPAKTGGVRVPPVADGGDDAKPAPDASKVVPAEARAAIGAVRRTPPNSTSRLIEALRPLENLGLTQAEAIQAGFGRFPVGGPANYSHDWLLPRFTPTFHLHQGTDVFASLGTPVRAPADGTLRHSEGAVGGLAAYVTEADGTFFYLAHLSGFVVGQSSGQRVKAGEVIGYNGDSGNAKGGAPHVHFEVHPGGGAAVDPKPYLDRWLSDALADVPRLIESLQASRPRALLATGLTRRLADGTGSAFAAPAGPSRAQLLWASSASPPGGVLRLAEATAAVAAHEVSWPDVARRQQAEDRARQASDARAQKVLAPLTPPGLRWMLGPR